jgi:hypothetical protein
MFYISYGCSYVHGPAAFRIPWGLQMLPAIFLFVALTFLPESPRWLARKVRILDFLSVLLQAGSGFLREDLDLFSPLLRQLRYP